MAITLPQKVRFGNARLQTLSWCLHIICGILIVGRLLYFGQHHRLIKLKGSVQLSPHYNQTGFQGMSSIGATVACDSPQHFDYWRESEGVHRYDNHSCIPICVHGFSSPCVKDTDVVFSQGPDTLFVATQIQDKAS